MYSWNELKKIQDKSVITVDCPVQDCICKVSRMKKSGLNLNSDKSILNGFFCKDHKIYISPTTWEYEDRDKNLLWNSIDDQELLDKIMRNGIKRESRMERDNSEDALTWNVFRYLENRINILDELFSHFIGISVTNSKLVYWSYCQTVQEVYPLLKMARAIFGEQAHQSSEPDLICETEEALIFIECKLTASNRTSGYGSNLKRHLTEPKKYLTGAENWFEKVFQSDYTTIVKNQKYELMRFWLLGTWMAKKIKKDFILINLVPDNCEQNIEKEFGSLIIENQSNRFIRMSWEEIYNFCNLKTGLNEWQNFSNYFMNKTIGYKGSQLTKAFF